MQGMTGAGYMPSSLMPGPPPTSPPPMDSSAMMVAMQAAMAAQVSAASGNSSALQGVEERMRRLETSLRDQEQMCARVDERARKAENETDSLRAEMKSLKLQHQEDVELIRRLQSRSDEQIQVVDAVKRELKQERDLRANLEAAQKSAADTAQSGLKVANSALQVAEGSQKAVLQMREERSSSTSSAHAAVETLERVVNDRFHAMEAKLSKLDDIENRRLSSGSAPMSPGRSSYFHNLHVQQSTRRLSAGSGEKEPKPNGGLAMTEVKPLMRRFP